MNTTSRPATPTLLPGEVQVQKGRTKKRRRNHKMRSPEKMVRAGAHPLRKPPTMPFGQPQSGLSQHHQQVTAMHANITTAHTMPSDEMSQAPSVSAPAMSHETMATTSAIHHQPRNIHDPNQIRLSTSSCSDADSSLKRSKRRRIPNKFYGYTSDEDSISAASALNSFQNPFKPQPPPNLTWSKDDLPKPSKSRGGGGGGLKNLMRFTAAAAKANKQRVKNMKQSTVRKNRSSVSDFVGGKPLRFFPVEYGHFYCTEQTIIYAFKLHPSPPPINFDFISPRVTLTHEI